ncbi:hypothetical protein KQI84_13630 [bacterium]|nr:hypothetical protein [bacterium]
MRIERSSVANVRQWALAGMLMVLSVLTALPSVVPAQDAGDDAAKDAGNEHLVTAIFQEAKVEQVLQVIGNSTGIAVTPFGKVPGQRVSVVMKDKPLEEVLSAITQPKGWIWFKQDDGGYGVADEAWYKANILPSLVITKTFRPDHVQASELERAIRPMLTSGISSVTADDRTNKLIVTDLPDVIERIERLIREIDVQLFTRVFYIRHADVADIAAKIETYKSDPGTIEVDEKTHQIIVTDLLANIKKMELLIDILDIGPEIVIYDVNNIGLDGEDLEDLQTIIEEIRTKDLLFEVNEKQGVFILEDVPEVHERVEQILEGFDQPVKQVLIQGEILSTTFEHTFDYGLNSFAYADDGFATVPGAQSVLGITNLTAEYPFFTASPPVISGAYLGQKAFASYQATFSNKDTKVLLQPRLLVKNQETSRIFVGSEVPFLTTIYDDEGDNTIRSTTQSTVSDGLDFQITPSISNSYLIEMEIEIDNDNANREPVTSQGTTTDLVARERQSIETVLTMPSGQTRVIGGLLSDTGVKGNSGLPFLANLPYLGAIFGRKTSSDDRRNLQMFITPTIVEDVIPRNLNEDGRRGRLITGYERVPGSYDLDNEAEFQEEGSVSEEDLLSTSGDAAGEIEDLMREQGAPTKNPRKPRDSSWTRQMIGGSGSTGGGSSGGGDRDTPPSPPSDTPPSETRY